MNVPLRQTDKIKILNSDDVYGIMQKILLRENKIDRNKEHFWTIGLDRKNRILFIELISVGGTYNTIVEPMQVFRVGVLKGAVSMIIVHNHPSKELTPSVQDKDVTDRLLQVGRIIQIEVIDHIIISEKTYLSFLDTGLLEQIKSSTKYVPAFELEARIKKQVEEVISDKSKGEKAREIAKKMKEQGETIKKIIQYTGLTEKEIKAIK